MNIRPIPMHLLIHEAEYEEFQEDSRYGESFYPAVTLQNVRVNFESSLKTSGNTESKNIKATMFFDLINSSATGEFEFREKSKVTFNGLVMQIQKINPIYTDQLHHYEVELA